MKKLLAILLALVLALSLCACGGEPKPTKKPDGPENYPKLLGKLHEGPGWVINELYVWDDLMDKKVYTYEILPSDYNKESGEKLPVIIYAHGGKGNADSLISEPKILVKDGIAGFTFEACGASAVKPLSDTGNVATSSTRASNMHAVIEYVKTLDWVDKDRIFIYGQSAGSGCVAYCAPKHNDDIAGIMLESGGFGDTEDMVEKQPDDVDMFFPAEGQGWRDYIKGWKGDVIICNSVDDELGAHENGIYCKSVYDQRDTGSCIFYSCPEGAHTFNSFSEEGQQITLQAMRDMVFGTK